MKRTARAAAAIAVLCAGLAYAQSSQPGQSRTGDAGGKSAFEVASVRSVPPDRQGLTSVSPWDSDLYIARNISLRVLIETAFAVDDRNIDGLADKLGSREFDVEARVGGQQKLSYEQMKPLLQNLLQERFHLAVHRVSRDEKGYALVVAKSGAKLKPAASTGGAMYILPAGLRGMGVTTETLAALLARPLDAPVQDRTGLRGSYDVTLDYRTMTSDDVSLPSIFTALQEQLGLKVVRAKVPVSVLVVDHVDAEPTAQ